jgi:hypothetical protein
VYILERKSMMINIWHMFPHSFHINRKEMRWLNYAILFLAYLQFSQGNNISTRWSLPYSSLTFGIIIIVSFSTSIK